WSGFQWIEANDRDQSVISFVRKGKSSNNLLAVVINFTPVTRYSYRIGVPKADSYHIAFNSDESRFGGTGLQVTEVLDCESIACHGFEHSISLTIPQLSTLFYQPVG
ncbi:MAG TPA: alpha amylase C-terminal domain-containing protein, partial [Mobilitalea sp.]|nr:alpha amylase C-terminal domain-containing protein [Mobilitalea sp.]